MIQWYVCTLSFRVPVLVPSFLVTNFRVGPMPVLPLPGENSPETVGFLPSNFGPKLFFCLPLTRPR